MREPAFTPGPWVVEQNDAAYVKEPGLATLRIEERATPSEFVVALVVTDVSPLVERAEANARLIAAAPALYAACEAVAKSGMRNEAYDLCVAALSLALGESPNA